MKKIFTFFALLAAMSLSASNINLHLTGCTSNEGNPTEYTDEDDYVELYFTAEAGYTLEGWEVTVKHGETNLPINDYSSEIGYVYPDAGMSYVFFIWYDEIEEDFDVTIVCKEDTGLPVTLPETFSAASFEEATFALEANNVYRPASFVVDQKNWFVSGAVAAYTSVADWGTYGTGYSSTQIVNYASDATIANGSDRYLPMAAPAVAHGKNYASINIMGLFEKIYFTKTTLSGLAITNTAFNVDAFLNGDGMSTNQGEEKGAPFGQGDYFKLIIKGLDGETVKGSIDFYLADFRTAGDWKFAENWQWINLTSLGEVDGLQFELESTKKNEWGMTTASYICVDNIGGAAADCTLGAMTSLYELKLTEGYASMCWDKNWTVEGAKVYTAQYNASVNLIDLYEVNGTIPAGAGVIVYAEGKGKVLLRQSHDEAAPLAYNSLVGVNEETAVSSLGLNNIYALGLANSAVAFCKYTGSNVPAHRAVLGLPTAASNVRMRIVNTTTDLENVENVRAIKHIENGQLIIERDGVRYNVMGIQF